MPTIGNLNVVMSMNASRFNSGIKSAKVQISALSTVAAGAALQVGVSLTNAVLKAGNAMYRMGRDAFKAADSLVDQAEIIGISTRSLAGFQRVMERSGGSAEDFNSALKKMNVAIVTAAMKGDQAATIFGKLGLNVNELLGENPEKAFLRIADAIAELPGPMLRAKAVREIFGRGAASMANVVSMGSKALQEEVRTAERLGIALTRIDAQKLHDTNEAFEELGRLWRGLGNAIAVGVAPYLKTIVDAMTDGAKEARVFGQVANVVFSGISTALLTISDLIDQLRENWLKFKLLFLESMRDIKHYVPQIAGGAGYMARRSGLGTGKVGALINAFAPDLPTEKEAAAIRANDKLQQAIEETRKEIVKLRSGPPEGRTTSWMWGAMQRMMNNFNDVAATAVVEANKRMQETAVIPDLMGETEKRGRSFSIGTFNAREFRFGQENVPLAVGTQREEKQLQELKQLVKLQKDNNRILSDIESGGME